MGRADKARRQYEEAIEHLHDPDNMRVEYANTRRADFEMALNNAGDLNGTLKLLGARTFYVFTGILPELSKKTNGTLKGFRSNLDRSRSKAINGNRANENENPNPGNAEPPAKTSCRLPEEAIASLPEVHREEHTPYLLTNNYKQVNRESVNQLTHARWRRMLPEEPALVRDNPPTAQEVMEYGTKRGFRCFAENPDPLEEANAFIDYNESQGWVVGTDGDRRDVTDWRGLLMLWDRRDSGGQAT